MDLRPTLSTDPVLNARRPFQRLLAQAAEQIGARLDLETRFGHVARVHRVQGGALPVFGNSLGANRDAAAALAADKDYTARLLAAAGLPTPDGLLVFGPAYAEAMALKNAAVAAKLPGIDAAVAWAETQGWPVIVKPNGGSEGRGISRAEDRHTLTADVTQLFVTDQKVRIETICAGADHRLVVWDGAVRLAYRRSPADVVGDGATSLRHLIDTLCQRLEAEARGQKIDADAPALARWIESQGYALDDVLAPGVRVPVVPQANLSLGGQGTDVSDALTPGAIALAERAAAEIGLRWAGVDILATDLTQDAADATILEVNSAPGLDGYATLSADAWDRARTLLSEVIDQT